MIVYVSTGRHAYTLGLQLRYYPGELASRVRLLPYESLFTLKALPAATYIFTDFDRLSEIQLERVRHLWDWLDAVGDLQLLNCPRTVKMRFELLRLLHERGVNDFNVYRLEEWRDVRRFPVFIRRERDHKGPITPLLATSGGLAGAVAELREDEAPSDLMIVEFGNEPWADGRYRKFGAQRVGGRVYHQHCYITREWLAKGVPDDLSEVDFAEYRSYLRSNHNAGKLRDIFDLACIDYGRIDYGMMGGRIQVFEINTNPTVIGHPIESDPLVDSSKYARMHEEAMLPIDGGSGALLRLPDSLRQTGELDLGVEDLHERTLAGSVGRLTRHLGRKRLRAGVRKIAARMTGRTG